MKLIRYRRKTQIGSIIYFIPISNHKAGIQNTSKKHGFNLPCLLNLFFCFCVALWCCLWLCDAEYWCLCSVPCRGPWSRFPPIPDLLFPVWEICRLHFLHPAALLTIISAFLPALLYSRTLTNFCPSLLPHSCKLLPFPFATLLQT
jgi:hypothetical protein